MDVHQARGYVAKFVGSGSLFLVGFQDRRVRVYDTGGADAARAKWRPKKEIFARQLCWTITDTAVSSDNRTLAYSTISPVVRLVNLEAGGALESVQNVTDIHEAVDLSCSPGEAARRRPDPDPEGGERFGVWSICLSRDGTRLVAGTSACSVAAYDLQASRPAFSIEGAHDDDVNAVSFLDSSGQVVVSGSDDSTIKLWDTRTRAAGASDGEGGHSGVFYGHTEGVTCVAPRGDGRYLVSNGKDQKAKLWDVRRMGGDGQVPQRYRVSRNSFDYRWQRYPYNPERVSHPHDSSVMTFMGHHVLHTLIRVNWSPLETTGQRFIYSGSACGSLIVYDILSGKVETVLHKHGSVVRDCDWHPTEPVIASAGWDGRVVRWARFREGGEGVSEPWGDAAHFRPSSGDELHFDTMLSESEWTEEAEEEDYSSPDSEDSTGSG